MVFQQVTGYRAPVWPPVDGEQRPMMHFDFQVGDLDSAVAEAVALGASVATAQPQENVRFQQVQIRVGWILGDRGSGIVEGSLVITQALVHDPELLLVLPAKGKRPPTVWDVHEDTAAALTTKAWLPEWLRPVAAGGVARAEHLAERNLHLILAEHGYNARFAAGIGASVLRRYRMRRGADSQPRAWRVMAYLI